MDPLTIGAAVVGGLGAIGDGGHQQRKNMREQNKLNKDFAQWNLDNIWTPTFEAENAEYDRRVADERAYNSPSAQVERMKEAGMYPTGENFESGTAGQPSGGSEAGAEPARLADIMNAMTNKKMFDLQALQLESIISKNKAETKLTQSKTRGQDSFNAFADAWYQGQINMQNGQISLLGAQTDLTRETLQEVRQRCRQIDANISALNQSVKESEARIMQMAFQNDVLITQKRLNEAKFDETLANIGFTKAETRKTYALISQIHAVTSGQQLANKITDIVMNQYYKSGIYAGQEAMKFNLQLQSYDQNEGSYQLYMEKNKLLNPKESGRVADVLNGVKNIFDTFGVTAKDIPNPFSSFQDSMRQFRQEGMQAAGTMAKFM